MRLIRNNGNVNRIRQFQESFFQNHVLFYEPLDAIAPRVARWPGEGHSRRNSARVYVSSLVKAVELLYQPRNQADMPQFDYQNRNMNHGFNNNKCDSAQTVSSITKGVYACKMDNLKNVSIIVVVDGGCRMNPVSCLFWPKHIHYEERNPFLTCKHCSGKQTPRNWFNNETRDWSNKVANSCFVNNTPYQLLYRREEMPKRLYISYRNGGMETGQARDDMSENTMRQLTPRQRLINKGTVLGCPADRLKPEETSHPLRLGVLLVDCHIPCPNGKHLELEADDREDKEDEQPTVVVLKDGDLSKEEADTILIESCAPPEFG
ncbi:hypothetical protein GQR58_013152 [Nymphon striatum]|nr:hypothetical protein GQR58_013152 [Nymphon striatum]